jgi:hypothetical protein
LWLFSKTYRGQGQIEKLKGLEKSPEQNPGNGRFQKLHYFSVGEPSND